MGYGARLFRPSRRTANRAIKKTRALARAKKGRRAARTKKGSRIVSASFFSVDDLGIDVERVLRAASVLGEERRARDNGKDQGIDERRRGEVGDRRAHEGEHGLRRIQGEETFVLIRLHVLDFKDARHAHGDVEGLGLLLRAFDAALERDEVDLGIFVCLTDPAGEYGLDGKARLGRRLDPVYLKRELLCAERFHGVVDHCSTSAIIFLCRHYTMCGGKSQLPLQGRKKFAAMRKSGAKSLAFFARTSIIMRRKRAPSFSAAERRHGRRRRS